MERISGAVEEVIFRNDENGYTVLVIETDDGEPVTAVGSFPSVTPGDTLQLEGEFKIHPRFGTQFKTIKASIAPPVTPLGIIKFLSSGLIPGCGEKTAVRIVEHFGKSTAEILEKYPSRLSEVKGISPKKARTIGDAYAELAVQRSTVMFLSGYGITVNLALKLYEIYGASTIDTVKNNPYILVEDVNGVGFITADRIARSLGIAEDSPCRIRAGVLHSLTSACEKGGNTYLPHSVLVSEAIKLLGERTEEINTAIENLRTERRLVVPFDDAVMAESYYRTERSAAVKLVKRVDEASDNFNDVTKLIDIFEKTYDIKLHEAQREAVLNAISSGVSVITGGPGTGKTTIINCILFVLDSIGMSALLLAPTGRAAKRITEGCDRPASTIHRALMGLERGEKFSQNAVIVDEFSMVDIFLFNMLLDGVNNNAKLVIVGDADQLPSVGAGNVLRDLIASKLVPVTRLSYIYRQSQTSRIAISAHEINEGKVPDLTAKDGDFFFFKMKSPEATADMAVELATTRITGFCGIEPSKIQVIAALKNGIAGVNNLNTRLQKQLNGEQSKSVTVGDVTFCEGDRVMHTLNNYDLEWRRVATEGKGVFNGDIGVVAELTETGEIIVEFEDGRRAVYAGDTRKQLILSYAITVHKSQGCEFDAVVMPVVGGAPVIMTRNLLYTAITRAKKMVVLVGDDYYVERMVKNNYVAERYSALQYFIAEAKDDMRKLYSTQ